MDIINLTINIKFCRISYHEKDWVERKTKCDYTVWNIISGGLALQINDQTLYAKEGDVLLFHPGDTYKGVMMMTIVIFLLLFSQYPPVMS